jgi:hypothetical protein
VCEVVLQYGSFSCCYNPLAISFVLVGYTNHWQAIIGRQSLAGNHWQAIIGRQSMMAMTMMAMAMMTMTMTTMAMTTMAMAMMTMTMTMTTMPRYLVGGQAGLEEVCDDLFAVRRLGTIQV